MLQLAYPGAARGDLATIAARSSRDFGLLALGDREGLVKTGLCLRGPRRRQGQDALALETMQFRQRVVIAGGVRLHPRLVQKAQPCCRLAHEAIEFGLPDQPMRRRRRRWHTSPAAPGAGALIPLPPALAGPGTRLARRCPAPYRKENPWGVATSRTSSANAWAVDAWRQKRAYRLARYRANARLYGWVSSWARCRASSAHCRAWSGYPRKPKVDTRKARQATPEFLAS